MLAVCSGQASRDNLPLPLGNVRVLVFWLHVCACAVAQVIGLRVFVRVQNWYLRAWMVKVCSAPRTPHCSPPSTVLACAAVLGFPLLLSLSARLLCVACVRCLFVPCLDVRGVRRARLARRAARPLGKVPRAAG